MKDRGLQILAGLFALFIFAYALGAWHYERVRPARPKKIHLLVYGDAVWHYGTTRSILFDLDLDVTNEARYYWHDESLVEDWRSPTGMLVNAHPVGCSLLWIPFVALIHLFVRGDGLSFAYPAAAALGSALLAWLALAAIYRRFGELAAVVAIWLGSNLAFYMSVDPLANHACAFFATTLFAMAAIEPGETVKRWVGLGALLGLAALVRTELVLLALLLLPHRKLSCWTAMAATAAFVFAPQLLVWKLVNGAWLRWDADLMEPFPKHALDTLFSPAHGLFFWHPVYLLGALGLLAPGPAQPASGPARPRAMAAGAILVAAIFYGWREDWSGSYLAHGYGARYFIALVPFFAIGLANGARWLREKTGRAWPVWTLTALLLSWNASMVLVYVTKSIPYHEDLTLMDRVLAPIRAAQLF